MSEPSAREQYYNRIAPVVGHALRGKTVLALAGAKLSRALGALGRTGVTSFVLRSGEEDIAAALSQDLSNHNAWESYDVRCEPAREADLIVAAGGGGGGAEALREARRRRIPAVIGWLLAGSRATSARLIWLPEMERELSSHIDRRVAELDAAPRGDPRIAYLAWLDLNAQVLSTAQSVLLRGGRRQCDELEAMWLDDGRPLLVYGSLRWPWEVRYPDLDRPLALSTETVPPFIPPSLTGRFRVMVVGCGTASLFVGEAVRYFRTLVLCDARPFSAFNPVRQLAGTAHVDGKLKPYALQDVLQEMLAPDAPWHEDVAGPIRWRRGAGYSIGAAELLLKERDGTSIQRFEELLDRSSPDVVVVAMGRSRDDNFTACRILRRRGIRHVVPTAFPGVTHYKHIVVDGGRGPCYECLQNRLPVDGGPAPELDAEARELFYGGTQPATLAETLPSAFSLLRLVVALVLPPVARPPWLESCIDRGETCFVGANRALERGDVWLYGVPLPHQVVTYGVRHVRTVSSERCEACGRQLGPGREGRARRS